MKAEVEQPDGSFRLVEMGDPECGEHFCDSCGDCLECQPHGPEDWCETGERWVIYLGNERSPFTERGVLKEEEIKTDE